MEFSVFAQRLFAVIGAGASTHAFTRSIFEAILTEDGQAVLDESSEESYKAYYNGNSGISRIARKVMPYIDRMEFENYLDQSICVTHLPIAVLARHHVISRPDSQNCLC